MTLALELGLVMVSVLKLKSLALNMELGSMLLVWGSESLAVQELE